MNMSTVLSPDVFRACIELLAVDDEIVEDDEGFIIIVEAANPRDRVNRNASITILDNDGKY